jgi:hypothetical protein
MTINLNCVVRENVRRNKKIDNPEAQATGRGQTKHTKKHNTKKTKKMSSMDPTKNRW